ncbi:MAG: hypothetical protein QM784_17910 [Polyangiaceae bacterium]
MAAPVLEALSCAASERQFGPACVSSVYGQITLHGPQAPTLWLLSSPLGKRIEVLDAGAKIAVPLPSD